MTAAPPTIPGNSALPSRKRQRRWIWLLLTLVLAGLFVLAWVFWPVSAPPLRIARDTTYLTGPLNSDGTVNYLAALNQLLSDGATPENNAAIPIFQALGPEMIDATARAAVLQDLGISQLPPPGQCFVRYEDFVRVKRPDLPPRQTDWKNGPARMELDRMARLPGGWRANLTGRPCPGGGMAGCKPAPVGHSCSGGAATAFLRSLGRYS